MLRTLLESNAPRQRRRGSAAASIGIHTAIIAGAIVATASANARGSDREIGADTAIVYVRPPTPEGPSHRARTIRHSSASRRVPRYQPVIPHWTMDAGSKRIEGPPIDFDVRRLLGTDSIPPGNLVPRGLHAGGPPGGPVGDQPATAATVDRAAAMLAPPRPRYPDQLRAAGVTGRVVVRLVVDTAGRVEPASVVIRESSHDLFAHAVRAVLPSLRFSPADIAGRKVRMLVDLPFEFRLKE